MLGYGANSDEFDTLLLHASRGVLLCCVATNIDPKEANQFKQVTSYFSSVGSHSTTRQRFFKATEPADLVFAPDDAETLWFDHAMSASVFAGNVANVAGATQTKRAEEAVLHFSLSSVGFGHDYGHGYGHSYGGKTDELLDFEKPLTWGSLWDKMPPRVHGGYEKLIAHFGNNPKVWGFWLEWYEGILNGTPLPWDLSFQIATTLTEEDWDAGPAHVADRIREIEENRTGSQTSENKTPPEKVSQSNVISLFDRSEIVQASMASLSESLTLRVDAFNRQERVNEVIPIVQTFENLSAIADQISLAVRRGRSADGAETTLALEVGRLRAEVENLRSQLKQAHEDIEELRRKPWYKSAYGLTAPIGVVMMGLWVLSGDDKSLEGRWNKLAKDVEFAISKIWPSPEDKVEERLEFVLPEITDT
ncbi:MAG: hypothetical protein ABJD13_18550 [Paracoccaceae bacterium]